MKKNKSILSFWRDATGKSQKVTSSSSPTLLESPSEQDGECVSTLPSIALENIAPESQMMLDGSIDNAEITYDVNLLPHDPGKRKQILSYPPNVRDAVRRGYIALKACQPRSHDFPQRECGGLRRFNVAWFDNYEWLEYSVENDATYCFYCYLFKEKVGAFGGDNFVFGGFRNWKKPERFDRHIGSIGSAHNQAQEKYKNFIKPRTSMMEAYEKPTTEAKRRHKSRLTYTLRCLGYLLRQGSAFRGHSECDTSSNRGNFLELLTVLAETSDDVKKVVLSNAPQNNQVTCHNSQKEMINCCAKETTKRIVEELGDDFFGILADESSDMSGKEQLVLCLRYVDKEGKVCERFLGIVHVENTCALTLKNVIESLLMEHSLRLSRVRGQGYDGASNMKGEIGGLKALIMDDSPAAYYVHCFAHQLQLTLLAVAKDNCDFVWLFEKLGYLMNVIGVSCKRKEMIRVVQAQKLVEALELGDIKSGQGLNQELGLGRPGDTRWGSHYKTILNVIALYSTIIDVLTMIGSDAPSKEDRMKAQVVMSSFESFDFVFMAHLMLVIFGYTDELSNALQLREQDIVNAMTLVSLTKERLQKTRDDDWEIFIDTVTSFCARHGIEVLDMDAFYTPPGRSRRFFQNVTDLHRFHAEMFLSVIDLQLQELNGRFDELSMELLICMSSLSPVNLFASFDKKRVIRLAEFYPTEFSGIDMMRHGFQLDLYIDDMRKDARFHHLNGLGALSMMLVETNKHVSYQLVYLMLKLVLILPVATTNVERVFSSMTYVKNRLRNSMCDQLLNDCLVTFVEKDLFKEAREEDVIDRFQRMKTRRLIL